MSIYRRYFRVPMDSPLAERLKEILDAQKEAKNYLKSIADEVGAKAVIQYNDTAQFAAFRFEPKIDHPDWTKPDKSHGGQRPRHTTKDGKALWARLNKTPEKEAYDLCLLEAGLEPGIFGGIGDGLKFHMNTLCYKEGCYLFVSTPWKDEDPEVLRDLRNTGKNHLLLWTPPEDWAEVREWEMNREIDQAREAA